MVACDQKKQNNHEEKTAIPLDPSALITLDQINIKPESPFVVFFQPKQETKIREAYIEGKTMYMGKIPLLFEKAQNNYRAAAMVGSCTEPNMTWRIVIITEEGKHLGYDFIVSTES